MLNTDAGSIPVTEGDRLIGIITDRDIAVRGIAKGNGPETPVRELVTMISSARSSTMTSRRSPRR